MKSEQLPILEYKDRIIDCINKYRVTLIVGSTGCGKTTQVPQYIYRAIENANIIVTQPRRVAAVTIAQRVCQEMHVKCGDTVGYSVRFDTVASPATKIKYVTEGVLLRECSESLLKCNYTHFILDEVHERTVNIDVLMCLLKERLKQVPTMKLILMSATIDEKAFQTYFPQSHSIHIPSQAHNVYVYNTKSNTDTKEYLENVINTIQQIFYEEQNGGMLVFLTGQEEIEDACEILNQIEIPRKKLKKLKVIPLFAALPKEKQMEAFEDVDETTISKVVLCTNIAETSITIPGIKYVIDCGYVKKKIFDPIKKMDILKVIPISQSSALQRAGRAGRICEGVCYRLYSSMQYQSFEMHSTPEIEQVSLTSTALTIKAMSKDFNSLDLMSKLSDKSKILALYELRNLGAIDNTSNLTSLGRRMAKLPLEPMISKLLLTASEPEFESIQDDIFKLVAMLSVENVRYLPKNNREHQRGLLEFESKYSDHITLINIFDLKNAAKYNINKESVKMAKNIYKDLKQIMGYAGPTKEITENKEAKEAKIMKCLYIGLPLNKAECVVPEKGVYTINGVQCRIHPSSPVSLIKPKLVVFNEIVCTSANYMRHVSEINQTIL